MTPTSDGGGVNGGGCTALAEVCLCLGVVGVGGTLKFSKSSPGWSDLLTDLLFDLFTGRLSSACEARGRFRFVLEVTLTVPFTAGRLAVLAERLSGMISNSADH